MGNKYFLHQVHIGKTNTTKGIVIHDTFDAALQGYHAYLGAYAYGHDADAICVQAMITDRNGIAYNPNGGILLETWNAPEEEPTVE